MIPGVTIMTKQETAKILSVIKLAYPHSFKDLSKSEMPMMVELWHDQFKGDTYHDVDIAVRAFISTSKDGYPPSIGQIKASMFNTAKNANESVLTAQAASAILAKAVSRSGWHSVEEFEKLPPAIQKVVHDPEMLKQWSQMDSQTFHSVVLSNFQRSYNAEVEREEHYEMLPESVKQSLPDFGSVVRKLEGEV
jgi:hypothetical protein